jgi:hypothetical protein
LVLTSVVLWYLFFALVTAISFTLTVTWPALSLIFDAEDPDTVPQGNKYITTLVFFVLTFILAPIMMVIYIVPSYSKRFQIAVCNQLLNS